jgi:hypothetical protein
VGCQLCLFTNLIHSFLQTGSSGNRSHDYNINYCCSVILNMYNISYYLALLWYHKQQLSMLKTRDWTRRGKRYRHLNLNRANKLMSSRCSVTSHPSHTNLRYVQYLLSYTIYAIYSQVPISEYATSFVNNWNDSSIPVYTSFK